MVNSTHHAQVTEPTPRRGKIPLSNFVFNHGAIGCIGCNLYILHCDYLRTIQDSPGI